MLMTGFLTTQLPIRQWTLQTVAAHQLIIPRHHRAYASPPLASFAAKLL